MEVAEDPLAPARGVMNGMMLSFMLWMLPVLVAHPSNFLPF